MKRILVVDDKAMFRGALVAFLSTKGYEIAEAKDGPIALELFDSFDPDMVLLDIYMPEMNGIDVLKKIKERKPDADVIMLTAVNEKSIGEEAMKIGALDFIAKPFDFDQLETSLSVHFLLQSEQ